MSRYQCEVCEYVYDEAQGDPHEGFAAGTAWAEVPDDWCCPDCGVRDKVDFVALDAGAGADADARADAGSPASASAPSSSGETGIAT